jgi:hypothetical protein
MQVGRRVGGLADPAAQAALIRSAVALKKHDFHGALSVEA